MPTPKRQNVRDIAEALLAQGEAVTSGQVAGEAGVTRQAAHYHLRQMVESGELRRVGQGRGARYERAVRFNRRYPLSGLEEDRVWAEVLASVQELGAADNIRSILRYTTTEMLNNAVDHSGGSHVRVTVWVSGERFVVEVTDDGEGIFPKLQRELGLPDLFAAIQELAKGKTTTDPTRHTGEGIFFSSKMVDRFEIGSSGLRWIVDNERGDQAVGESSVRRGTRVRLELDGRSERTTRQVFDTYSDAETYQFKKSAVTIKLFEQADRFISRSEAKRLAARLEQFSEVVLDFSGVEEVGQGFVDELFRVWAIQHPQTKLIPVNMSPAVESMLRRGIRPTHSPG